MSTEHLFLSKYDGEESINFTVWIKNFTVERWPLQSLIPGPMNML